MNDKNILTDSSAFSIGSGESRWIPLALHGRNGSIRYGFSPVRVTFCLVIRKKRIVYKQRFQLYIRSKEGCRNAIKWSSKRRLYSSPKSRKICPVKIELGVSVRNKKRAKRKKFKAVI
ncbi:hypothetical protein ACU1JV_09640 [Paenibacillus sp. T2-29]|uniref:hypothetical protein n=1 Tax=Paenibacillus TaxID=44249 RepID=UPI0039BCE44F